MAHRQTKKKTASFLSAPFPQLKVLRHAFFFFLMAYYCCKNGNGGLLELRSHVLRACDSCFLEPGQRNSSQLFTERIDLFALGPTDAKRENSCLFCFVGGVNP